MDDIEKARVSRLEGLRLTPSTPNEVCQEIGLEWLSAISLCNRGYLSFNPEAVELLNKGQEAELLFLGYLILLRSINGSHSCGLKNCFLGHSVDDCENNFMA
ncbi:MAG: hypothetical protein FJ135_07145 [Deltaproteobacteria bacterium]|nr:hypothetical protein [Deltaproteobacteria bacterium]